MGLLPTMLNRSPSLALLLMWWISAASLHQFHCSGSPVSGRMPASYGDGLLKTSGESTLAAAFPSSHGSWLTGAMSGSARKLGARKPSKGSSQGSSSTVNGSGVKNVMDFGAKGDGSTDDSKAFASAWTAACSSPTAAELLVQEGKRFLLPPMTFSGPCKADVILSIKGTVIASPNKLDWVGKDLKRWLTFAGIKNLKVKGGGTFNGNGPIWWKSSCKVDKSLKCTDAPTAVTFSSCTNLELDDIRFKDSQKMHVTFGSCSNVRVSNLFISAPGTSPNTDGIHVTGTANIHIKDSVIETGDDCISIVSGSQNVNITNIRCGPGHGISIGSLGENGAEHTVSNVLVDTAHIEDTTNGVRIKTWQGGRGYVKDIIFRNIFMKNVRNPIIIDQNYCDSAKKCPGEQKSAVAVSGVTYKNITGTSAAAVAMELDCSKSVPCRDIVLHDINLAMVGGSSTTSICNNAFLSKHGSIVPPIGV